MSRHTKSDSRRFPGKTDFKNWNIVFSRSGQGDLVEQKYAAAALFILRDTPGSLEAREGRDLFVTCRRIIRGTVWEELLFSSDDAETRKRRAKADRAIDEFHREFIDIKGPPMSYEAVVGAVRAKQSQAEGA